MAASQIDRHEWTDDDGTGTTGTIINNARLQEIYDDVDELISGTGDFATLTLGGNVKADGAVVATEIRGPRGTRVAASISGGNITIDMNAGDFFEVTINANWSIVTSNTISSGKYFSFYFVTKGNGTGYSAGWPGGILWAGGITPTVTSTNNKRDIYLLTYDPAGAGWFGAVVGQNF